MQNRYVARSRISEARFRRFVRCVAADLTAVQITQLTGLNRNTVNRLLGCLRERMAQACELERPFRGHVEVDESYFGPRRVKGKARHGWPEDLDGGGSFGAADRAIGDDHVPGSTIGDSGVAPSPNYNVLMDFDFSGTIEQDEYDRCQSGTGIAALDAGAISDPDFDSGPWSCTGYDGYVYDDIADLSCVRFRWYDAALGRWMTRDPIGVRGESVSTYENVLSSPLNRRDHMGLASDSCTNGLCTTSMQVCRPRDPGGVPVVWNITEAPPLPWRTPQDLGTEAPDFDSLDCDDLLWWTSLYLRANGYASLPVVGGELERHFIDGMTNELQTFAAWYNSQRCLRWTVGLPHCPCVIDADCPPDQAVWGDVTTRLWGYHVGAHSCIRSRPVNGAANQCCYDDDGRLITHGSGSGSADRFAAVGLDGFLSHRQADMSPADSAMLLDAGLWSCFNEAYLRVRPQVGSSKCPTNP